MLYDSRQTYNIFWLLLILFYQFSLKKSWVVLIFSIKIGFVPSMKNSFIHNNIKYQIFLCFFFFLTLHLCWKINECQQIGERWKKKHYQRLQILWWNNQYANSQKLFSRLSINLKYFLTDCINFQCFWMELPQN